jgi:hypothetical protein
MGQFKSPSRQANKHKGQKKKRKKEEKGEGTWAGRLGRPHGRSPALPPINGIDTLRGALDLVHQEMPNREVSP